MKNIALLEKKRQKEKEEIDDYKDCSIEIVNLMLISIIVLIYFFRFLKMF